LAEVLGGLWWLPLLRGVLLIAVGCYALFRPAMTAVMLTQVVGFFVALDGMLAIVAAILGETPSRGWRIVRGVLAILIGGFVLGHPIAVAGVTTVVVMYVIAAGAIASGTIEIMAAIRDRKEIEGAGWMLLGGALAVLFGVLLLIAPMAFGQLIVRVVGAYAIVFGVSLVAVAFRVRGLGKMLGQASE
jgi:uncharacterized membrane protein HdeD (DUF308 family)